MEKIKKILVWIIVSLLSLTSFNLFTGIQTADKEVSNVYASAVQNNGTMMQYFEWYLPNDGQLWNKLNKEAKSLSDTGITALWIPPAYKGSSQDDVGYGVYDMYDLGEFNQKGTVRTKYGTKAELKAAIESAHANGMSVYGDTVMNHRMGADGVEQAPAVEVNSSNRNQVQSGKYDVGAWTSFTFPGRKTDPEKSTKFEWKWWHFDGVDYNNNNGQNKIFRFDSTGKSWDWEVDSENGNYDYLMGADLDFDHPEVQQEMKDWGEWYRKELNLDGYRLDAVKHIQFQYLQNWTNYQRQKAGKNLFTVGEYWSPDYKKLDNFQNKTGNVMSLFDAPLHYNFRAASTSGGGYDLRAIEDNTMMKYNGTKAVTLVDNHDTQTGQALQSEVLDWFKPQAYNYILLHQSGYPSVFYKDYYNSQVGPMVQKLVKARKLYAYGTEHNYNATSANANTGDLVGWTREGDDVHQNSGLASLISDNESAIQSKWMEVGKKHAGEVWYDYTGNMKETVVINADGWGEFKVAGSSQSVWVKQAENNKPLVCKDKQIIDGEYRFYVNDCDKKVVTYALQFHSYEENVSGTTEAIKGYQYYPNTVYDGVTDEQIDGTMQEHVLYEYEMNQDGVNSSKPRHGVVKYAAKYNDGGYMNENPVTCYEYYNQAEFMKNNNQKIYRILNLDTTGKVRNEIRRNENTTVPNVVFEFFNRLPYEKGADYSINNNLKTTFKLLNGLEIAYGYGKHTPQGYSYMYTYKPGTIYDGTQGSKITNTVVQKNEPANFVSYDIKKV